MLFLDNDNKILKDVLDGRIGAKCVHLLSCTTSLSILTNRACSVALTIARAARPVQPLEIRLCDFDGALLFGGG